MRIIKIDTNVRGTDNKSAEICLNFNFYINYLNKYKSNYIENKILSFYLII
jgi:hypothetical protein